MYVFHVVCRSFVFFSFLFSFNSLPCFTITEECRTPRSMNQLSQPWWTSGMSSCLGMQVMTVLLISGKFAVRELFGTLGTGSRDLEHIDQSNLGIECNYYDDEYHQHHQCCNDVIILWLSSCKTLLLLSHLTSINNNNYDIIIVVTMTIIVVGDAAATLRLALLLLLLLFLYDFYNWIVLGSVEYSFGWEYKPRSCLCTHAFHRTDSKDPDFHVLDGWMPATKTYPARTIHEDGMWLP